MSEPGAPAIFSVGHGRRTLDQLFAILAEGGVMALVDVRRYPKSARHPQFGRDSLEAACRERGVRYDWLGGPLGGFRAGGYTRHVGTAEFREGLAALEGIAREIPTAFLCSERSPASCHRRFLARELERRGWTVVHLLDEGTTWTPDANPQLGLFADASDED